ncbi:MAG: hypothetical protein GEV03_07090 [Streptosporangiales bacterium]|nr:hypothetical protein [Streptosporangiales bacterium]
MRRLWAAIASAVVAIGVLTGCAAEPFPQVIVRDFLLAWQDERYRAAASYTTGDRQTVTDGLRDAAAQLGADGMEFGLGRIRQQSDSATARFTVQVDLMEGTGPQWSYQGRVSLRRVNGVWKILWSPSVIHPGLGPGQRLAVATDVPRREPILDTAGRPLVRPTPVVTVGVRPGAQPQTSRAVHTLARLTRLDGDHALALIRSAPDNTFVPLVTLERSAYRRLRPALAKVEGLRFHKGQLPLAPAPKFADALLGRVGPATKESLRDIGTPYRVGDNVGLSGLQLAFQRSLGGTPDTKVVAQGPDGRAEKVLQRWPGKPAKPVRTTIDRRIQAAAEKALADVSHPASLVAVEASSGKVLAAANRHPPSNSAFTGRYPPGSVFQLVSSAALLRTGLTVDARIPCPPQRIVGGEVFRNSSGSPELSAPAFRASFATSCTTAFVGLARRLPAAELSSTARLLGVGESWSLPVDAFTGSLPPPRSDAQKAAYMIGEGPVRVSPLTMALAAGAIDSGTWRPPELVTDPSTGSPARAKGGHRLPEQQARALRALMRSSVKAGTADAADLPGSRVYGLAGAATEGSGPTEKTYDWFVGFRGDIAFALVLHGEGVDEPQRFQVAADGGIAEGAAAEIAARFLQGSPKGAGR